MKPVTKAAILMNLGSPDSPSVPDVRKYLNEFLMDSRVLDFPAIFRFPLVRGIITPFRAPKSAKAYETVWREDGSPLVVLTQQLGVAVQAKVDYPVRVAMRYGNPSPKKIMDDLKREFPDLKEVVAFPLYPHYTMSSYETAVAYANRIHQRNKYPFSLKFISPFYNHPEYIASLSASIKPYLEQGYDKILFSYHGLPERHMRKDDATIAATKAADGNKDFEIPGINYQKQCHETTRLVAAQLNIPVNKVATSFQSRLKSAGNEWIKPYTVLRLEEIAKEGVKKLLVVCPAFINDCLETLEEIAVEGKEIFEHAGGEHLEYIPCMNAQPQWVDTVAKWLNQA